MMMSFSMGLMVCRSVTLTVEEMFGDCDDSLVDLLGLSLAGVQDSEGLPVFFNVQIIMGSLDKSSDQFWCIRIYCETTKLKLSLRKIQLKRNATNSSSFSEKVDAMLKRRQYDLLPL